MQPEATSPLDLLDRVEAPPARYQQAGSDRPAETPC
jgi:hypothetical protein